MMSCDPAQIFDTAVAESRAGFSVRAELPEDSAFLETLYCVNAPLAAMLPPVMLLQQHQMQEANFGAQYPQAMWRILLRGGQPVGRIIIDWSGAASVHGVDIAVLPDESGRGGGLILLRAWLTGCDALGRHASLFVRADNRARRLYAHLGFTDVPGQSADTPMVEMTRPACNDTGIKAVS
jgi:ribosomal protein S18 acetylase RimI-like enzyme